MGPDAVALSELERGDEGQHLPSLLRAGSVRVVAAAPGRQRRPELHEVGLSCRTVHRVERMARRVLWTVLGVVGLAIAAVMLVIGIQDAPKIVRFFSGMPVGCWGLLAGPPLFWSSLMAMYFRSSKQTRSLDMGRIGGRTNVGAFLDFFRRYRQQRGLDFFVWIMLLSGTWCVIILWLAGWDLSQHDDAFLFWLITISSLWVVFLTWLLMFTPRRSVGATRTGT